MTVMRLRDHHMVYLTCLQSQAGRDRFRSKSNASVFGRLGSLKKSKLPSPSSSNSSSPSSSPAPTAAEAAVATEEGKTFVVQYLGHMPVSMMAGLDMVRPVVQVSTHLHLLMTPTPHQHPLMVYCMHLHMYMYVLHVFSL